MVIAAGAAFSIGLRTDARRLARGGYAAPRWWGRGGWLGVVGVESGPKWASVTPACYPEPNSATFVSAEHLIDYQGIWEIWLGSEVRNRGSQLPMHFPISPTQADLCQRPSTAGVDTL